MEVAFERWQDLQFRQELHDQIFHNDIYNLAKPHRLTHLVLHHCKYTSAIYTLFNNDFCEGFRHGGIRAPFTSLPENLEPFLAKCVDGMIVALSMLNVAGKSYYKTRHEPMGQSGVEQSVDTLVECSGKLAKVVEDIDHMGQENPLGDVVNILKSMTDAYATLYTAFNGNTEGALVEAMYRRLNQVEMKHIWGTEFQTRMLNVINAGREHRGLRPLTRKAARIGDY